MKDEYGVTMLPSWDPIDDRATARLGYSSQGFKVPDSFDPQGNPVYGNSQPSAGGQKPFDQAAYDLQQANLHNAFRVDNTGAAVNAYGAGGQSTGGVNGSAIAPGFEGYNPSQPGGQLQQNGGSSQQNQYLSPQGQNAYMPQSSGQNSSSWGQSPWVNQTANALTAQSNQNLMQNVMPGIRSGAQSAGQYGGSRQAIAEGVAAGNAQTGLNSALASLYGNAYGQDQNAALQNKSLDNSYNLGLGNLSLTNQGQMQNFYTQQRGQDLQGVTAGANLYNSGNQGNLGIGQGQYNLGQTSMNAPANAISQYNSLISPYTGFGQSNTTSGQSGGGLQGVAGGAMAGAQIANNLGFGNTMTSNGGWGTGNQYGNQDLGLFI